jgi:hypothetical protein
MIVRTEFYKQYAVADGTSQQKAEARKKAFQRAIAAAQANGLVMTREASDGTQLIWLAKPEEGIP